MREFAGVKVGDRVRVTEEFIVERIGMHGELYYAAGEESELPEGAFGWEYWPTEYVTSVEVI